MRYLATKIIGPKCPWDCLEVEDAKYFNFNFLKLFLKLHFIFSVTRVNLEEDTYSLCVDSLAPALSTIMDDNSFHDNDLS